MNKTAELFHPDITIDDIARDPNKFGAPTFEQFLKGYAFFKNRNSEETKLAMLDEGPNQIKQQIRKIFWVVKEYKCETPEKAQAVAKDLNIDLKHYRPELREYGGGKCDIYLHFDQERVHESIITAP